MQKLTFTFDKRLLIELGRELVSKDEVAVSELVKNSYDADATIVNIGIDDDRITITDNGTGMNMSTIQRAWLVVGTTYKKRETVTRSGRRVLGEKGIGRLSAFRLGSNIEIRTRSSGEKLIVLKMKLPDDGVVDTSDMLDMEVSLEDSNISFPGGKDTGTMISISDLREPWDSDKIQSLQALLSRLVHPFDTSIIGFSIIMTFKGESIPLEPPEKMKYPNYSIEVGVSDDGTYSGIVKYLDENSKQVESRIDGKILVGDPRNPNVKNYRSVDRGGCGPIKIKVYAWDRDSQDFRGFRKTLDYFSGFYLMRNGFLVVQPKTDWLGLNMRRVQNPTMRLSTNQIVGAIYIDSDLNRNLIDKTDREGLIENDAFFYLRQTIYIVMSKLEEIRYKMRRSRKLSKGNALLDIFDTRDLHEISKNLPDEARESVDRIADDIDRRREELEELILGRDRMATLGVMAAELIHAGRNALVPIVDGYRYIEKNMVEVPEKIRRNVEDMVKGGRMLSQIFSNLDPYMKFRTRRETEIHLSHLIDMLKELYSTRLKQYNIRVDVDVHPNIVFTASQTDILILLTNFLVNSIYWAPRGRNPDGVPKIKISARSEGNNIIMEFEDSGPGVQEEQKELIFDLGVSFKEPPGTGIGLAVNRDIVTRYGGRIELIPKAEIGGARFIVTLPKGEVKK
ncbi:ATP-binding protein [Cuniculiplasma sp. SKW4]|uniref:sensor histidine kinase n=1 Tax=Cuniculiplasma sp. SKW4 TaxID=3400171 RepID=UPI003FD37A1A